ncbi:MAG TPA: hypothetical protein VKU19_06515 [Bryobacteraceae bacterium]|nr:hypothetical protein [Bryobacteraceae bacterium]
MPDETNPIPLAAYLFGKLTHEEQSELMRRALSDQKVFNQLWDAVDQRELLQNPAVRARLLRRLEEPAPRSFWSQLFGPLGRTLLASAAVACVALILVQSPDRTWYGTERPLTLVTTPQSNLAEFFRLPARNPLHLPVDLHRSPAVFHPGDVIHATVILASPSAVFALRHDPNGSVHLVFPSDLAASANQPAGEVPFSFDPVSPTEDVTARESFTLRVLVLPPGIDLRNQSIEWARLGRHAYSTVEVGYEVVP